MIDYGGINQRIAAFDAQHGDSVHEEGWILFADGAAREANPMGPLLEPPRDDWPRLKRILHYHEILLQRAVNAFNEQRHNLTLLAKNNLNLQNCGPAPNIAEATSELKQLQKQVKAHRKAYAAALAAVEAAKPARLKELEEQNASNRAANEALLEALKGIEV